MVKSVLFVLLVSILVGETRRRVTAETPERVSVHVSVRPRDFNFRHKLNSTCQFWSEELSHRNVDVHNVMDSINQTLGQIEDQLVKYKYPNENHIYHFVSFFSLTLTVMR